MGKKRRFVDKKKAVTFFLEPAAMQAGAAAPPAADGGGADDAYNRRDYEFGELGLPNDGYDYSQHMREIGDGAARALARRIFSAARDQRRAG